MGGTPYPGPCARLGSSARRLSHLGWVDTRRRLLEGPSFSHWFSQSGSRNIAECAGRSGRRARECNGGLGGCAPRACKGLRPRPSYHWSGPLTASWPVWI